MPANPARNTVDIAVFVRPPLPGCVKTRLIPTYGPQGAMRLYRAMARSVISTAHASRLGPVTLWAADLPAHRFFRALARATPLAVRRQAEGDLGFRMTDALAWHANTTPVLLVGTDLPALTIQHLTDAGAALHEGADVVLLTTEDGGFGLIGVNRPLPPGSLAGIQWSTRQVHLDVTAQLEQCGLSVVHQGPIWDVDEPADVLRWLSGTSPSRAKLREK